MREKIVVGLKRVRNTVSGAPRFKVVDCSNEDTLKVLVNNKIYFKNLKSGIHTIPNTRFSYKVCNGEVFDIPKLNIMVMTVIR